MRVPPSLHHTPGPREKSGRGGAWTRAGASSRWQQRAAAPPHPALPPRAATPRARIMDVELSYFALPALEFETPDEHRDS